MSKNSVQQALSCFSKNNPPWHAGGGAHLPLLPLSPRPISTHPKLPAQSVKVILSGASSLTSSLPPPPPPLPPPFIPFYVFLLRRTGLAPPAGERLEWRCIPNQIRGRWCLWFHRRGLKLESRWDWLDRLSGAGAGITPCWLGGSGRCSWTEGQLRLGRSGSTLPHNTPLGDKMDILSLL